MPRFSVIVPSHGVAGRLSLALDSVLGQSFGDFELIPVCDTPEVAAAGVAAGYAERDARVVPAYAPSAEGLAGARNTGIRAATGSYLLFLDGDDTLAPGALAALDARLADTGDVDVLYFGHEHVPWWKGGPADPAAAVLPARLPEGAFAPAEAPGPTGLRLPAWSAAYRRAFLMACRLAFPHGHFTDVGFGGLVALRAARMAVLRSVVVRHLLRRQGDRLGRPGEHHVELLDRVEELLERAAELRLSEDRSAVLFEQLFALVLETAADPSRLPARRRRAFFRRAARLHRVHRPAGFRPPDGIHGLRHRLLAAGAYTAFRELTRRGRPVRGAAGVPVRRIAPGVRAHRTRDRRLVVYSAFAHRGVFGDPGAVYRKALEIAPQLRGVWVVRDAETAARLPEGVEHVLLGSPAHRRVVARAGFFIDDVEDVDAADAPGPPGPPVERPGGTRVHTHRATPLTYLAADLLALPGGASGADVPGMLRGADRWDYSLVASPHSELVWERAYPCRFTSVRSGSPRNDVLVGAGPEAGLAVRDRLGIPAGHTVVLYAPARREQVRGGHADGIDPARLAADLGAGHTVVVCPHPSPSDGYACGTALAAPHGRGTPIDASGGPRVEEVMLASDVLVTDYSPLMFDYANLDRPIVVHAPADDWAAYRAARGAYLDITAEAPGRVTRTYRELSRLLASGGWREEPADRPLDAFRSRFCAYDDGRAAERVVRGLLLGEEMPGIQVPAGERTWARADRGTPVG